MKILSQRVFVIVVILLVVAAVTFALLPQPVAVDVAEIRRGALVVTITDDGRTRIRERYVVSAPLSGRLVRIRLKPADPVVAHQTQLTMVELGHRNDNDAEIVKGLEEGDRVILYPGDRIENGVSIRVR